MFAKFPARKKSASMSHILERKRCLEDFVRNMTLGQRSKQTIYYWNFGHVIYTIGGCGAVGPGSRNG